MASRRTRAKRAAKITAGTVIVLGLGAVVAGVAIYEFTKPKAATPTTGAPGQLAPSGTGVTAALAPA
jgi:hypothetical protein